MIKKFLMLPILLMYFFVDVKAGDFVFTSDFLCNFEERAKQIIEPIKSFDPKEVQVFANFLHLSRLIASKDIELRENLDLFMQVALKLLVITDNYDESANLLEDALVQKSLNNLRIAFHQRNQAYKLWRFADKYLETNASGKLTSLIELLQSHGQEAFLQFIDGYRERIYSDIIKLENERKLTAPYLKVNTAITALQVINSKKIEGLPMLNVLGIASDTFYKSACECIGLVMQLNEYVLLSQKFSYHFHALYCNRIYSHLSEYYPQYTAQVFEIGDDGNCIINQK